MSCLWCCYKSVPAGFVFVFSVILPAASKLTFHFSFHMDILFTSDVIRSLYSLSDIFCASCVARRSTTATFVQFFTHIARYITSFYYQKPTMCRTLPCQFHKACILKLDFGAIVSGFLFPSRKRILVILSVYYRLIDFQQLPHPIRGHVIALERISCCFLNVFLTGDDLFKACRTQRNAFTSMLYQDNLPRPSKCPSMVRSRKCYPTVKMMAKDFSDRAMEDFVAILFFISI